MYAHAHAHTHGYPARTDKYVILIPFPRQRCFANAPLCHVIRSLPVLLEFSCLSRLTRHLLIPDVAQCVHFVSLQRVLHSLSLSTMFSWNRCLYRGYTFSRFRYVVYLSFRFSKSGPFHVTSDCNRYCCGGGPLSGAKHPTDGNESLARRKIFLSTDISGSILPNELISRLTSLVSTAVGV
jgi:hypothetical protein